ncbi:peptidylprolyl isomerase, partial [Klebsiella pneumoniae]
NRFCGLGELRQGEVVLGGEKFVFPRHEFELDGPVKTKFGYHIIKVLYRK